MKGNVVTQWPIYTSRNLQLRLVRHSFSNKLTFPDTTLTCTLTSSMRSHSVPSIPDTRISMLSASERTPKASTLPCPTKLFPASSSRSRFALALPLRESLDLLSTTLTSGVERRSPAFTRVEISTLRNDFELRSSQHYEEGRRTFPKGLR
jgi:hypothetical protein